MAWKTTCTDMKWHEKWHEKHENSKKVAWETWKFEKSGMKNMKIRKKIQATAWMWHEYLLSTWIWHEKQFPCMKMAWKIGRGMKMTWINLTWHECHMKKPDVAWKRHEFLGKNSTIVARLLGSLQTVSYQTREPGSRYSPCNLRGNRRYCPRVPVDFKENVLIWNIFKKNI